MSSFSKLSSNTSIWAFEDKENTEIRVAIINVFRANLVIVIAPEWVSFGGL